MAGTREHQLARTTIKGLRAVFAPEEHAKADSLTPSPALLLYSFCCDSRHVSPGVEIGDHALPSSADGP